MAKKINATVLRKLVLETVREIESEDKVPTRKSQLQSILENAKKSLFEDATPGGVDSERFPLKLSDAAAKAGEEAEKLATGGDDDGETDDDIVQAAPGKKSCKDLKPSQSSMNIHKAVCFALAAIKQLQPFSTGPGGDLGAIITSDDHIMDGHHRWIASGMVDPSSEVGGFVVEFPAKQMIAALNMITVKLGITQGKPGSGGFDQFNEAGILAVLEEFAAEGAFIPGKGKWKGLEAPVVLEACEEFSGVSGDGAIAAAAKKMAENASELTLSVPDGFPERPDMPVISKGKGHLKDAIELLRTGQVDLNEPYFESKQQNNDQLIVERWNRLAGVK